MLDTAEQRHAAVSTAMASVQSSLPSGLPELSDDDLHSFHPHAHHVIVDAHLEKIGCLQRIHVLNMWQPPRPSNPELGRCISEIRFCYRGWVRFDD